MTVLLSSTRPRWCCGSRTGSGRARWAISRRCARRSPRSGRAAATCGSVWTATTRSRALGRQVDDMIVRLEREERMRRELFAAVSHDLRTPITSLGLLATAIDDSIGDEATRREYAARMNTHVGSSRALIDDLFDLTRLQAQELDVVDGAPRDRRAGPRRGGGDAPGRRRRSGGGARRRSTAPLARSHGNREQLRRVLFNLIQNAIHHTPPGRQRHRPRRGRRRRRGDRGRRHRRRHRRRAARARLRAVLPRRRRPPAHPAPASGWRSRARSSRPTAARSGSRTRRRHARALPSPGFGEL